MKRSKENKNPLLRLGAIFAAILMLLGLTSCHSGSEKKLWPDPDKPRIVSTTEMVHAIVASIGKDAFQYQVLITGELDPHSYQLVKGDGERLASADRIFANGLSLEHGPSLKKFLESSKATVFLGDILALALPQKFLSVSGQVDPHIWMDLSLFAQNTHQIAHEMALLVPSQRDLFFERARKLRTFILTAHDMCHHTMQQLPEQSRYLVTSHDAFHYFVRAYIATEKEKKENSWTSRMIAAEGLAPESQISISQIAMVADFMQAKGVATLFAESNINTDAIRKIESVMRYRGVPVRISTTALYGDSMPSLQDHEMISRKNTLFAKFVQKCALDNPDSQRQEQPGLQFLRYIAMITHNIETIYQNLLEEQSFKKENVLEKG